MATSGSPSPSWAGRRTAGSGGCSRASATRAERGSGLLARLLVDDVDGCLLGGRSAAIDPRVVRDEIGIVVAVFLILGHEPARPRVRAVVGREPAHVHDRLGW